jgi:hypothetical protein
MFLWKDIAQHRIESSPGSAELGHRYLGRDAAITRENRASADRHSDIRVDMGAGMEKPFEHRRMNAEPSAASGKPYLCPFDDDHVPTGAEEHASREQTAEGSSDHDGATHVVTLSKKLVSAENATIPSGTLPPGCTLSESPLNPDRCHKRPSRVKSDRLSGQSSQLRLQLATGTLWSISSAARLLT